eukprot:CAMPEP_0194214986 /NCGR_PEP_ID=MMETSP0156-20130528/16452_1 /TAXON_ID=33649 /ORGANISM="Thalassionema nitzschioides, Strain L26-B" /LENGTH=794 /DNA_ID=CAMNT_0038943379 /DNA_START=95 /DNA_END=2479 /DNA_ORIENTATION=+
MSSLGSKIQDNKNEKISSNKYQTIGNKNHRDLDSSNTDHQQQLQEGSSIDCANMTANQTFQRQPSLQAQGSRRISVGNGPMDRRRSSMNFPQSFDQMNEIFNRRSSVGFDGNDAMFSRRDSLDSTTAVLDACIMDLTRRRMSMATRMQPSTNQQGNSNDLITAGSLDSSMPPPQNKNAAGATANSQSLLNKMNTNNLQNTQDASEMSLRQKQIHEKQTELDKRQKEIDLQRQQLFATLQNGQANIHQAQIQKTQGVGFGGGEGGGMGNVSTGINSIPPVGNMPRDQQRQQWWICQVCNTKAFASCEEAVQHEAICGEGRSKMNPPIHDQKNSNYHDFSVLLNQDPAQPLILNPGGGGISDNDQGFNVLSRPLPLAMASDKDWLTPLHCFVRRHCVEVFCATTYDVATPSKGKRKPITVGQVGIRCPHCQRYNNGPSGQREKGSVYYPTTISSIYNATMNLLQRHLHSCPKVSDEVMKRYQSLKTDDARSGSSKKYWIESALSLGLVDTPRGIRFSKNVPPSLPPTSHQQQSNGMLNRRNSNDFFSSTSNANRGGEVLGGNSQLMGDKVDDANKGTFENGSQKEQPMPLVTANEKPYATMYSFYLLGQMQPCVFTEADRLGKRKGLPAGFAGLACQHCFGGYGSGRFFPSSIKTLSDTSKTLNVLFNHMMRCRKCPQEVKQSLEKLRATHDLERSKMKFGSQKAFFAKIWARLHEKDGMKNAGERQSAKRKLSTRFMGPKNPTQFLQSQIPVFGMQQQQRTSAPPLSNILPGGFAAFSRQLEENMHKKQRLEKNK